MMMKPTARKDIQEGFHRAALDIYNQRFTSYRDAEHKTGVNYSTIYTIVSRGRIPTRGQVIEWAEGLHEPINKWLELAGYDLIEQSVDEPPADPVDAVRLALRDEKYMSKSSKEWLLDRVRETYLRDKAEYEESQKKKNNE